MIYMLNAGAYVNQLYMSIRHLDHFLPTKNKRKFYTHYSGTKQGKIDVARS